MAIDGVTAGQGLTGGGTSGNVPVAINAPVSLLNGGTGVSAFSAPQMLNAIGALPTSGGTMAGNLTVVGGIVVGTPTGANKGAGAINAEAIYINDVPVGTGGGLPMTGGILNSGASVTPLTLKNNAGLDNFLVIDNTPNGGPAGPWRVGVGTGGGFQINDTNAAPPQRLTINPDGTVNVVHNFDVGGTSLFEGAMSINTGTNTTPLTLKNNGGIATFIQLDNTPNAAGPWSVGVGPGGGFQIADAAATPPQRLTITATGEVDVLQDLWVGGNTSMDGDLAVIGDIVGGTVTPSDRRVKQNIEPWENCGLDAVCRLKPIRYQYNGLGGTVADGRIHVGLDADETTGVIPEMVGTRRSAYLEGTPIKTISPGTLTFALVNAIKELATRLDRLEGSH